MNFGKKWEKLCWKKKNGKTTIRTTVSLCAWLMETSFLCQRFRFTLHKRTHHRPSSPQDRTDSPQRTLFTATSALEFPEPPTNTSTKEGGNQTGILLLCWPESEIKFFPGRWTQSCCLPPSWNRKHWVGGIWQAKYGIYCVTLNPEYWFSKNPNLKFVPATADMYPVFGRHWQVLMASCGEETDPASWSNTYSHRNRLIPYLTMWVPGHCAALHEWSTSNRLGQKSYSV